MKVIPRERGNPNQSDVASSLSRRSQKTHSTSAAGAADSSPGDHDPNWETKPAKRATEVSSTEKRTPARGDQPLSPDTGRTRAVPDVESVGNDERSVAFMECLKSSRLLASITYRQQKTSSAVPLETASYAEAV